MRTFFLDKKAKMLILRQESGSSRGVPDPSASLDAIHPADRSSPHVSGNVHR